MGLIILNIWAAHRLLKIILKEILRQLLFYFLDNVSLKSKGCLKEVYITTKTQSTIDNRRSENATWLIELYSRVQLKRDDTQWRTGGEVRGKLAKGVGSPSHCLRTWCIQHYYRWCVHLDCQESTEWTPRRFKWTRPFRRKTKAGFCACAITFQT